MIYTGQYGLKALGWLSLSKLCTTAEIWNGWSQATLPWVHNLSVWLLLASIPSWKFSETFNDVLQWMLTHFFNEENSATSGRLWQKFNQKFVLLTMSLQTISGKRSEKKKACSQIGWLKIPSARGSSRIGTQPHKANTLSHNRMSPKWYQISQYYCTFAITDPSVGICWISINYKYNFFGVI